MLNRVRQNVEKEMHKAVRELEEEHLRSLPRQYRRIVTSFLLRKGKRVRPVLLVLAFRGYAGRSARNLYRAAVGMEFLHEFILIHDDIVDHSSLRRGLPSLHRDLDVELKALPNARFTGTELAMLVGDMVYAMAVESMLTVGVSAERKHKSIRHMTRSAFETGCGEINELILGLAPPRIVSRDDILQIYDQKTSHYSFVSPLVMGATLAGAPSADTEHLTNVGILSGRAFQIENDVEDLVPKRDSGMKTEYSDLREGKKTLPLWLAYKAASARDRGTINRVLAMKRPKRADLAGVAAIIERTGGLDGARKEASKFMRKARAELRKTRMSAASRTELDAYLSLLLRPSP